MLVKSSVGKETIASPVRNEGLNYVKRIFYSDINSKGVESGFKYQRYDKKYGH